MLSYSNSYSQNLKEELSKLSDVSYTEIHAPQGFEKAYKLKIKQLIDHSDSSKGFFYQKVFLTHRSFKCPTVLITNGYEAKHNLIYELTKLISSNQIYVEHRYYGESIPDSISFEYLNLKQITADLHYINQLFKKIYPEKWISTGISKGGQIAIFYKYFYSDDIDVCFPYVAPIAKKFEDNRFNIFLDTVGDKSVRKTITDFQIRLLKNREYVLPKLKEYCRNKEINFTYLTLEQAFEYAVLEYAVSFWQWGIKYNKIPSSKSSLDKVANYFLSTDLIYCFSDEYFKYQSPLFYQAATEMGYYSYNTNKFKDFIKTLSTDSTVYAAFPPKGIKKDFNPELLDTIHSWIEKDGKQLFYIYGSLDVWSSYAVNISDNPNSKFIMMNNHHHGNARISRMSFKERKVVIKALEKWLEIDIRMNYLKFLFLKIYP